MEKETTNASEVEKQLQIENLEYKKEVDIGSLEAGETKVLSYNMLINQTENNKIDFSVIAKKGQEEYHSNNWQDKINNQEIDISMTDNTKSQYLKAGDILEYTIVVQNKAKAATSGVVVKDNIPAQLTVKGITQNGEKVDGIEGNKISLPVKMEANEDATIKIETVVNYSEARERAEAITNTAYAEIYGEKATNEVEINHIIKANEVEKEPGTTPGEDDENKDNTANNTITGVAWYDENKNGQKEQGETLLSNIKVKLLNTETNKIVAETTTNENGIYVLDKIQNGKYIAIFEYDNTKYTVTKYQAEGIIDAENSNAVSSELLIENEKQSVIATDILTLDNTNLSYINIGLIPLENFDLQLEKQVSKVIVQNKKGTTIREYDNETMAKVELDGKTINGSTVIIEYQIKVTNNGEVEGYAKKIADYATTDLKFSSELNRDWYQVGDTLYTTSLANEKIKPGESKTVTLTLTKAMTENSTGVMPNIAEIAEDYNELGIADSNSTPGNRAKGENDLGTADVLLSIKTGGIVYAGIGIVVIAILSVASIIIIKKRKEQEKE